jgi:hypothetical protein
VRTTYKRGFSWFKFQLLQTLLNLRATQLAIRQGKRLAENSAVFWKQNQYVQPLRRACEACAGFVSATHDDYVKFTLKRCQKKYLWELASKKEAQVMGDVGRFSSGVLLTIAWEVLTPWSSFFWSLLLPLFFGYFRSIQPLGVPNRPFPWPVLVGFSVMAPLKFGDAIESWAAGTSYVTAGLAAKACLLFALVLVMYRCRNMTYNLRWAEDFSNYVQGVRRERVNNLFNKY